MGRKTKPEENGSALDVAAVMPILTEAEQVRAKVEADRRALEQSQAELATIEARAREAATPDLRSRVIARAEAEADRIEGQMADARLALADAERKVAELTAAHEVAMTKYRNTHAAAVNAEREARQLSRGAASITFQIGLQRKRIVDARTRLTELSGADSLP